MYLFDPMFLMFVGPAFLLAMWAQWRVSSTYAAASRQPARLSGAAAARHVLDSAGLHSVRIEHIGGRLSDHYDPRAKVLRLSQDVYGGHTLAAVGIAAHEAGHAIQDAKHYAPLVVRNLAVPAAGFGSQLAMPMLIGGFIFGTSALGQMLLLAGIVLFAGVVAFQVVNLPVEFDASARAKAQLVTLGIVDERDMGPVKKVLSAAAMTYVAATLQAVLTLLYYIMRLRR